MPKGPKGQKRPADVIGNAVRVMEIATGFRGGTAQEQFQRGTADGHRGRGCGHL